MDELSSKNNIVVNLRDLVSTLESGKRPKGGVQKIKEGIPSIGAEHLNNEGGFDFKKLKYVPVEFADNMKKGKIHQHDIIIVKDGATTAKTSIVDNNFPFKVAVINEHVFLLRPKEIVLSKWVFYYLWSSKGKQQILKDFRGAAQGGISSSFVDYVDIPIPSIEIQKITLSKIEELFSNLEKGIEALKTAQEKLKIYKQVVLKWAFEGKLTREWRDVNVNLIGANEIKVKILQRKNKNLGKKVKQIFQSEEETRLMPILPKKWTWVKLGNHAFVTKLAGFEFTKYVSYKENGEIPVIRAQNVTKCGFKEKNFIYVDREVMEKLKRSIIIGGEILLVFVGAGLGNCGIAPKDRQYFLGPNVAKIHVEQEFLNKFIYYYLSSTFGFASVIGKTKATAQGSISMANIREVFVPLISIEEQKEIVNQIELRLSICEKFEQTIEKSLRQAAELKHSILKKAFEGNLVKQVTPEFPKKYEGISTTDLHAGLLGMFSDAHSNLKNSELNNIKLEKFAHLVESKLGISLGRKAYKNAAGPADFRHLKSVEHRAIQAGWIVNGYTFKTKLKINELYLKIENVLPSEKMSEIKDLIDLLKKSSVKKVEILTTVYTGWNNLLIQGMKPTDKEIVFESRNNWSKEKLDIDEERFYKAIKWMKDNDFIPYGRGQIVSKSAKSKVKKKRK